MTNGGSDHDHLAPTGAQVSWPPPPIGGWPTPVAAGPPPSDPKPAGPSKRGEILGIAVVVVLIGALVAIAFTVLGDEPRSSAVADAEPKFEKVGNSIDGSSTATTFAQDPSFEPSADPELLSRALPKASEVEEHMSVLGGGLYDGEEDDKSIPMGPLLSNCTDERPYLEGGRVRVWPTSTGEINVRIDDLGSAAAARESMDARRSDAYITCLPDEIAPQSEYLAQTPTGGDIVDSVVAAGAEGEVAVLIDRSGGGSALFVWRQVGQYNISAKVFVVDPEAGIELTVASADDLLDAVAANLGD